MLVQLLLMLSAQSWEAVAIEPLASDSELPDHARGVFFLDDRVGWVVSMGKILATEDGGANWTVQYRSKDLVEARTSGEFNKIWFQDRDNGFVIGGFWGDCGPELPSLFWRTRDGGKHWESVKALDGTGEYYDLRFVDAKNGWLVGTVPKRSSLMKTADGGESWEAVEGSDAQYEFVSSTVAYSMGRDAILKTEDGGKTWTRRDFEVDGDWGPKCFCFVDADTGWIAVNSNADVYLLHTADGGASWERRGGDWLRGVDYPDDVRFISRTEGWLLVHDDLWSRIYHTTDSGKTWKREAMVEGWFGKLHFTPEGDGFAVGGSTLLRRKK